jgi:hypothetical protein
LLPAGSLCVALPRRTVRTQSAVRWTPLQLFALATELPSVSSPAHEF